MGRPAPSFTSQTTAIGSTYTLRKAAFHEIVQAPYRFPNTLVSDRSGAMLGVRGAEDAGRTGAKVSHRFRRDCRYDRQSRDREVLGQRGIPRQRWRRGTDGPAI